MASVARRAWCRLALVALPVALVVGGLAGPALAQESFRVTYDVDRSNPGRTKVTGVVFNDGRVDVLDVYVTAEAVNSAGKILARGIAFVSPSIPQGSSVPFDATVPAPPNATGFRVRVTNYRLGLGLQSP